MLSALGTTSLLPLDGGAIVQVNNHFYWVAPGASQAQLVACVDDPQRSLVVNGTALVGKDLYASVADRDWDQGSVARIPLPL